MSDLDVIREARDYLAGLIEGAVDGPWAVEFTTPSMGGENWNLRTAGKPGIRITASEYQHGPDTARLIVALRAAAPLLIEALDTAIAWQEDDPDEFLWASHADAARAILATKGQDR